MKLFLVFFILLISIFDKAEAAICWYVSDGSEMLSTGEKLDHSVERNNNTCSEIENGSFDRSVTVSDSSVLEMSANASSQFKNIEIGLTSSDSTTKENTKTISISEPSSLKACLNWKVGYFHSFTVNKYRKHLKCWSVESIFDNGSAVQEFNDPKGPKQIPNIWQGAYPQVVTATVKKFGSLTPKNLIGPKQSNIPPCPCNEDGEDEDGEDDFDEEEIDDPTLENGNKRKLK